VARSHLTRTCVLALASHGADADPEREKCFTTQYAFLERGPGNNGFNSGHRTGTCEANSSPRIAKG
jgi:hypothetical protein